MSAKDLLVGDGVKIRKYMKQKLLIILLGLLFFSNVAFAQKDDIQFILRPGCSSDDSVPIMRHHNKLNVCVSTKKFMNNYEPKVFESSNNLLRRNGQESIFCGEKVVIRGRVVDSNCVPISDAKVYLWQVGCDGKYPYEPLRNRVDEHFINLSNKSTFQGSGIATTNNNGEFQFITIYPAKSDHKSPYVNIRVEHRDAGELQTKFFMQHNDESDVYDFDITMPVQDKHRRY